jgi:hypothetical protein
MLHCSTLSLSVPCHLDATFRSMLTLNLEMLPLKHLYDTYCSWSVTVYDWKIQGDQKFSRQFYYAYSIRLMDHNIYKYSFLPPYIVSKFIRSSAFFAHRRFTRFLWFFCWDSTHHGHVIMMSKESLFLKMAVSTPNQWSKNSGIYLRIQENVIATPPEI